eukprot:7341775-Pyramimonas_sp.AAC.1
MAPAMLGNSDIDAPGSSPINARAVQRRLWPSAACHFEGAPLRAPPRGSGWGSLAQGATADAVKAEHLSEVCQMQRLRRDVRNGIDTGSTASQMSSR